MKATRTHQWTSLLLSGALVAGMMITPSLAAGGAELEFQYPSDVKAEDVTITVHEGVPADSGEDAVKALPEVKKNAEGDYLVSEPGTYSYWVRGDGYYNVCKIFNVTQKDLDAGSLKLEVETGKMAYTGYEPTSPNLANVPENYDQGARDSLLILWSDEVLDEYFSTDTLKNFKEYDTPFFTKDRADHQFTTQDEMMSYLTAKDQAEEDMYLYSLGKTPAYQYDMPIAVFTETDLSSAKSLEASWSAITASSPSGSSPRSIPTSPPPAKVRWSWSPTCAAATARRCWTTSM